MKKLGLKITENEIYDIINNKQYAMINILLKLYKKIVFE